MQKINAQQRAAAALSDKQFVLLAGRTQHH